MTTRRCRRNDVTTLPGATRLQHRRRRRTVSQDRRRYSRLYQDQQIPRLRRHRRRCALDFGRLRDAHGRRVARIRPHLSPAARRRSVTGGFNYVEKAVTAPTTGPTRASSRRNTSSSTRTPGQSHRGVRRARAAPDRGAEDHARHQACRFQPQDRRALQPDDALCAAQFEHLHGDAAVPDGQLCSRPTICRSMPNMPGASSPRRSACCTSPTRPFECRCRRNRPTIRWAPSITAATSRSTPTST